MSAPRGTGPGTTGRPGPELDSTAHPARPPGEDSAQLTAPRSVHRAGETALLAEYPDTPSVLAAAAAVRALAPPHLLEAVPAERTLLLVAAAPRDLPELTALLQHLPAASADADAAAEVTVGIVYDGEDLADAASLLGMSTEALIAAHSGTGWVAAFGGFAPGFAYLLPDAPAHGADPGGGGAAGRGGAPGGGGAPSPAAAPVDGGVPSPGGPPWDVPRRAEPRTAVPAGAVGLAARYCGIYPRESPGGWQLIGRSDAVLFDPDREPPALLTPGTRVRFAPERPTARAGSTTGATARAGSTTGAMARAGSTTGAGATAAPAEASGPSAGTAPPPAGAARPTAGTPVLEVVSPGPLALLEDAGRPGRAASGVTASGAFDRGAMLRANLAVGNPARAAVLEVALGPVTLQALAPTVVALAGAHAPLRVQRAAAETAATEPAADASADAPVLTFDPAASAERPIALDPGDRFTVGPATVGLRLVLAVRGGLRGAAADGREPVLGSWSRDTLSGLGPAPLRAGDVLCAGPQTCLDAVSTALPPVAPAPRTPRHRAAPQHEQDIAARLPHGAVPHGTVPVAGPEVVAAALAVAALTTGGDAAAPDDGPGDAAPADSTSSADSTSGVDSASGADGASIVGDAQRTDGSVHTAPSAAAPGPLEIAVHLGPRDGVLGEAALAALLGTEWRVRPDSDRVGVRLDGAPLPVPEGSGTLPSEPMVPGAIQVPPSGLPVVFGPDHPTTGGYPVIAVVTRAGLDLVAQSTAGTGLRFVRAQ